MRSLASSPLLIRPRRGSELEKYIITNIFIL